MNIAVRRAGGRLPRLRWRYARVRGGVHAQMKMAAQTFTDGVNALNAIIVLVSRIPGAL